MDESLAQLQSFPGKYLIVMNILLVLTGGGAIAQIALRKRVDYTPALWTGVVLIFLVGLFATLTGVIQFLAAANYDKSAEVTTKGLSILLNPVNFGTMCAGVAVILVGAAATVVRISRGSPVPDGGK